MFSSLNFKYQNLTALLDLYGLSEDGSYRSNKWVQLHTEKFVWVYYCLLFDLINISPIFPFHSLRESIHRNRALTTSHSCFPNFLKH